MSYKNPGLVVRRVAVVALVLFPNFNTKAAEYFKARDFPQDKSKWTTWVQEKTELIISGRYEGRFSTRFRLSRLDMTMSPKRATIKLPNIEPGVRLSVYGRIIREGTRYAFEVSRIVKGQTDLSLLRKEAATLNEKSPEESYAVADRFQVVADFYEDELLTDEILKIRLAAFSRQRADVKGDAAGLRVLAKRGPQLKIPNAVLKSVIFESFHTELAAENLSGRSLAKAISEQLEGWDDRAALTEALMEEFVKTPIKTHDGSDEKTRKQLHRLLYRRARLAEILGELHEQGRNGAELATLIEEELPEEKEQIDALRKQYVDYRLARVPHLTRARLIEMVELLKSYDRFDEFSGAVDAWLEAQNERLNDGTIDGLLGTAEEYFFAFQRWKNASHQQQGVELKKRAWEIASQSAPKMAEQIEKDLERLGWIRIREQWMSEEEVEALPEDDIELAIREGRVVPGMTPRQAMSVMSGKPERRIRFVSFRVIREIWVFGRVGSSGIIVHFQRKRESSPDTAVVTKVEKLTSRF